jgi:hypothetical protein
MLNFLFTREGRRRSPTPKLKAGHSLGGSCRYSQAGCSGMARNSEQQLRTYEQTCCRSAPRCLLCGRFPVSSIRPPTSRLAMISDEHCPGHFRAFGSRNVLVQSSAP